MSEGEDIMPVARSQFRLRLSTSNYPRPTFSFIQSEKYKFSRERKGNERKRFKGLFDGKPLHQSHNSDLFFNFRPQIHQNYLPFPFQKTFTSRSFILLGRKGRKRRKYFKGLTDIRGRSSIARSRFRLSSSISDGIGLLVYSSNTRIRLTEQKKMQTKVKKRKGRRTCGGISGVKILYPRSWNGSKQRERR